MRLDYPANVKIILVPCTGKVDVIHMLHAVQKGADGVYCDRVRMYNLSSGEGPTFAAYAKEMTEHIRSLGPNPLSKKNSAKGK
jgi:F420-non-reducing hydrogenase iron-sulfur subunit